MKNALLKRHQKKLMNNGKKVNGSFYMIKLLTLSLNQVWDSLQILDTTSIKILLMIRKRTLSRPVEASCLNWKTRKLSINNLCPNVIRLWWASSSNTQMAINSFHPKINNSFKNIWRSLCMSNRRREKSLSLWKITKLFAFMVSK